MPVQIPARQEIFNAAAEIHDPAQREAFLDQACAGDVRLRAEVEELLRHDVAAGSFLEQPAPEAQRTVLFTEPADRHGPGTTIGRYKLLEQIGEGGMGVVFMAEQTEPVRRKVALKLMKPGLNSREVVARFEAERQALAMMDHPNIARVFDGGTVGGDRAQESGGRTAAAAISLTPEPCCLTPESGRPYFVMELVRGIPITEYCDQARLTTRERLELFVQVCRAVQHAHTKGIIHRDLKPSNVLVTLHDGTPIPKVIDFGVAKATNGALTDKTLFTQFAQLVGTPLYMSPEQAALSALDVDTRSDIYSLGVLLYELLTGTTPFERARFETVGYDEMRRLIREEEPPRPSTRLSTIKGNALSTVCANRSVDAKQLSQSVHGELDWIVMKALEKDRTRRYETASAFAADIDRYLADEPVLACPPSVAYRLRKLARRHKAFLAAAATVLVALSTGTGVSVWQAVEATEARRLANQRLSAQTKARQEGETERERATANYVRAREAVKQMLTRVADEELGRIPEMKEVRLKLLEDAVSFYTELLKLNPRDPLAHYERGHVHELLAQYDKCRVDYEKAVDLQPGNAEFHRGLSFYLNCCPDVAHRDYDRALLHARLAIRLAPELPKNHENLAYILSWRMGKPKEALEAFRRAAELYGESMERHFVLMHASMLTGDDQAALQHAQESIRLYPQNSWVYKHLTEMHLGLGQYEDAILAASKAIAIARNRRAESADPGMFYFYGGRADAYAALKMYPEALADYDAAVESGPFRSFTYKYRAMIHFRLGRYAQALADLAKAVELKPDDLSVLTWIPTQLVAECPDEQFRRDFLELVEEAVRLNKDSPQAGIIRAGILLDFGNLDRARADFDAAVRADEGTYYDRYQMALLALKLDDSRRYQEICTRMVEKFADTTDPSAAHYAAWAAAVAPNALDDFTPAILLARRPLESSRPDNRRNLVGLGATLLRVGQYDEALTHLTAAAGARGTNETSGAYISYLLAMTQYRLGRTDEARAHLARANEQAERELGDTANPPHWNRRLTLELFRREAESLIDVAVPAPRAPAR